MQSYIPGVMFAFSGRVVAQNANITLETAVDFPYLLLVFYLLALVVYPIVKQLTNMGWNVHILRKFIMWINPM